MRSASFVLALLETLVFFGSLYRGFAAPSANPMLGPPVCVLNQMQAKNAAQIVYNYQLWRLIVPIFLHAGVIHLLANLSMALRVGVQCEYDWGTPAFLTIYFMGGITSMTFSALLNGASISVGASGALMAVYGAWIATLAMACGMGDARAQQNRRTQLSCGLFNLAIIVVSLHFTPRRYVALRARTPYTVAGLVLTCGSRCIMIERPAAPSLLAPRPPANARHLPMLSCSP